MLFGKGRGVDFCGGHSDPDLARDSVLSIDWMEAGLCLNLGVWQV